MTYQAAESRGGFVQGIFAPLQAVRRSDWGAPRLTWFSESTKNWDVRLHAIGADTFFKLLIRRHDSESVWSWALEWNHSIRVVGFAGDEEIIRSLMTSVPDQPMTLLHETAGESVRFRTEVPLPEHQDDLFTVAVDVHREAGIKMTEEEG